LRTPTIPVDQDGCLFEIFCDGDRSLNGTFPKRDTLKKESSGFSESEAKKSETIIYVYFSLKKKRLIFPGCKSSDLALTSLTQSRLQFMLKEIQRILKNSPETIHLMHFDTV